MSRRMLSITELWRYLKSLRININVKRHFTEQVKQVDQLLENDKTGIVSTIYDFMVHSATVPMKIETKNETLDNFLKIWQKQLLNKNVNIDIPVGLRALSTENFRERWRSSLLALKVNWGKEKFGNQGEWIVPKQMWFLNGGAIESEDNGSLTKRKYFLKKDKETKEELKKGTSTSVFIRKPFTPWHKKKVTPYLVQRGALFNALMKNAIVQKQSDVIEAILPIILQIKAGNDKMALEGMNPSEEDYKNLKDKIVEAKKKFDENGDFGDIIASLRHDVNLDYLIPDLTKILDDKIIKSTDRNLLSSLGLIELKGFSTTREEAILNPKVLVEEVVDAVLDWADLLHNVMIEMLDRNIQAHPTLANAEIRVIPGRIKAFVSDAMRTMLRSLYDRGLLDKQTATEDIADIFDFEGIIERRIKEDKRGLQKIMKAPIIQNLEQYEDVEQIDNDNMEDQDKKPGTPESDNFNNAIVKHYSKHHYKRKKKKKKDEKESDEEQFLAPYDSIDELPENVRNVLPVPAQLIWLRVFNSVLEETGNEERAIRSAWSQVKKKYEKVPDKKKWQKKASLEDYKDKMSSYTYKFFQDVYYTALDQTDSEQKALATALAIIEKASTKNKDGKWVKDKTITKNQIQALDSSDFVGKLLDLEIKEKKSKLLDKLLNEEQ